MYLSGSSERPTLGALEVGLRVAVVTASMVGAAVADAAPTGTPGIDVVWRALIAVVVTSAALLAGPVARMVPALVATAVAAATESWTEAAAGCAILTGTALAPHRGPRGVARRALPVAVAPDDAASEGQRADAITVTR